MNFEGMDDIYRVAGERSFLTTLTFELNTTCNWRCQHCYIPHHDNMGLSTEKLLDTLKQARQMGVVNLAFTGGEIFLRDDIMTLISSARRMGFCLTLFSNISLLHEEVIRELALLYISKLCCTVYSLDENIHDEITRSPGSLKITLKNLECLKKYKVPVIVNTPLMRTNHNAYKMLREYCTSNGFGYKPDKEIFSRTDGHSDPHQYRMTEEQLLVVAGETDSIVLYEQKAREVDELACETLRQSLFIDAKGSVFPCNRLLVKIGEIGISGLDKIWTQSDVLHKLQRMTWGDAKDCISCPKNRFCVRCPGLALQEHGDLYGKSLLACSIASARCKSSEKVSPAKNRGEYP